MTRTLLLNASYEPLAVVPLRRAVLLVLTEKAEIVEVGEDPVRSARDEMLAPLVIRLKRYVKIPYRARVGLVRPQCSFERRSDAHVWENVVWACTRCNNKKGSKTLEKLGWKLDRKPVALTTQAWFVVGLVVDPSWEPYLSPA